MSEFTHGIAEELAVGLFDRDIIKFGEFTLKSGRQSPIYYNQRPLLSIDYSHKMPPRQQKHVASLAVEGYASHILKAAPHEHLYGIPQAATAIGARVAYATGGSYLWGRVGKKDYGAHEAIEGDFAEDERVIQLDDVIVTADSKLESEEDLRRAGLETVGFVIMLDREEGGRQALESRGHGLDAVLALSSVAPYLKDNGRIGNEEIESLQSYHEGLRAEGIGSTFDLAV